MERNEKIDALLADYLDGNLNDADLKEVERILDENPELASEMRGLGQTVALLKDLPKIDPPADFTANVLKATTQRPSFFHRAIEFLIPHRRAPWPAIAAGAVACLILIVLTTTPGVNLQEGTFDKDVLEVAAKSHQPPAKALAEKMPAANDLAASIPTKTKKKEIVGPLGDTKTDKALPEKTVAKSPPPHPLVLLQPSKSQKSSNRKKLAIDGRKTELSKAKIRLLTNNNAQESDAISGKQRGAGASAGFVSGESAGTEEEALDLLSNTTTPPPPASFQKQYAPRSRKSSAKPRTSARAIDVTPVKAGRAVVAGTSRLDDGPPLVESPISKEPKKEIPSIPMAIEKRFDNAHSNIRTFKTVKLFSQNRWQTLWNQSKSGSYNPPPAPSIDFSKYFVVGIFLGEKRTGGYSVTISRVQYKQGRIIVIAHAVSPPPGGIVPMVLTHPSSLAVVAIPSGLSIGPDTPIEFIYE